MQLTITVSQRHQYKGTASRYVWGYEITDRLGLVWGRSISGFASQGAASRRARRSVYLRGHSVREVLA